MRRSISKIRHKALSIAIDGVLLATGAALVLTLPVISAMVKVIDEKDR